MKKIFFIIVLLFNLQFFFGQKLSIEDKKVSEKFQENFNSNNFNDIFLLFSDEMKSALPKKETNTFLQTLKNDIGEIKQLEFESYIKGTFASFKTIGTKDTIVLNISANKATEINGFFTSKYLKIPNIERNSTKLILPFKDIWTVTWGGDTKELNYHVESKSQKNAFDLIITNDKGTSYKTNGLENEDYYAFGKEIIAPADAEIVYAIDGVKDNIPGELNPFFNAGNCVMLKTKNNEFIFIAHFKQQSIQVKQGQTVKKGSVLGLCGNSGSSSEPHIHFHIQNIENMNLATGVKCYFEKIKVNGNDKYDYSPIKGEKIEN